VAMSESSDRVLLRDMFGVCTAMSIADGSVEDAETAGIPGVVAALGGEPLTPADVTALKGEMYADIGRAGDTHTYLMGVGERHDVAAKRLLLRAAIRAMRLDGAVHAREQEKLEELGTMFAVDLAEVLALEA
jgi:tellurite resistance protein